MAEQEEGGGGESPQTPGIEEIFINGGPESDMDTSLLYPNYGPPGSQDPESVLPRRSSLIKDSANRQGRKKTVSFSSMPSEKKIANATDCLNYMINGSELIKVRSNSRQYHRFFTLDEDLSTLRWQPTSKKPNKARISIESIKEIRVGKNTEILRNKEIAGDYSEECAFSIIYGDAFETLDLIANSADEANIWVTGLMSLIGGNKSPDGIEEKMQMRDKWLLEEFNIADKDVTGFLDEYEVIELMKKLNNCLSTFRVKQKIKEIDLTKTDGKRGRLSSKEFAEIFKDISTRPEIYFLLVRYANKDYMSVDDLQLFLEAEQGMTGITKERCFEIIQQFEPSRFGKESGQLGIDGFTKFLLSEECDIFEPAHKSVCEDMNQPLAHYFIATSHNTYLLEDQLKGPSSIEGYIRALKKGCRCIELDVWDGPSDDPVIYHGHTLTSKISFKSAIETINQYAFEHSEYPLILLLENHCCIKQQQFMVEVMKCTFGDKLFLTPTEENITQLPSPETIKRKILIKGKKLPPEVKEDEGEVTEEDEGAESNRARSNKRGSIKKHRLCQELSDLIIYLRSVRFEDFQISQQKQKSSEMCSFSESAAAKLAHACPEEFVNHNKKFLSRIYPNGMRVDSSNYNPQDLWNCGCQMVALNYQTPGLMMDLSDGRFRQNGGCGYVLKPSVMREEISYFSANTRDIIPGVSPQILHIKIISGQQFPKPKGSGAKGEVIDPYVTVEIFGIPADCAEEKTKTINNNGINPIFDESFEFQINLPELALVRFVVLDDDYIGDDFIGQYTIPFECLQTGYRHIRLLSNTGEPLEHCMLFVHIAITNRRGGGKPHKRGMSVRRSKRQREHTGIKTVGVKIVDETFKTAVQPLKEAMDVRNNVEASVANFKELCGPSTISNMKQCMRLLSSRLANSSEASSLTLVMNGEYPVLEVQGNIPDMLRKPLVAFETMVSECKTLIEIADSLREKLIQVQQAVLDYYEDLSNHCVQAGLKGRKLSKATENYAWNVRILKGQADLLSAAKKECKEYMKQIYESSITTGLLKGDKEGTNNPITPESPEIARL